MSGAVAGGMMGPFIPQVDFVDPATLTSPPTSSGLPPVSACGQVPDLVPMGNGPLSLNSSGQCPSRLTCVDWPGQSWPEDPNANVSPPLACCSTTAAGSPTIDFVATQFSVPVDATNTGLYPASLQDCSEAYGSQQTPCSQIVYQSPQGTAVASGTLNPPVPITIVGVGFGYLSNLPQLMTSCGNGISCASNFLEVSDCAAGDICPPQAYAWDTSGGAACQVYIAGWTGTSISIIANLPTGATDMYSGATLSPLSDISPLTLMPAQAQNFACPVSAGDTITISVINPQSLSGGTALSIIPQAVSPALTTPN
jgi:hypothetical protein